MSNVHAVRLAVSPNATIDGVGKNSPTVLSRFWTKVYQIWAACTGDPVNWHVSFRLWISCSVVQILSVISRSRSQKSVFCPQASARFFLFFSFLCRPLDQARHFVSFGAHVNLLYRIDVTYRHCSVLLWRHCNMLCTSGFVDVTLTRRLVTPSGSECTRLLGHCWGIMHRSEARWTSAFAAASGDKSVGRRKHIIKHFPVMS